MGFIERGRITEVSGTGYIVESLDRKGILSPPLQAIGDAVYAQGEMVLFVLFRDGMGKIISGA